jgi:hypothetical protein
MNFRSRIVIAIANVSIAASAASAQALRPVSRAELQERNPRHLDAVQLLEQRTSSNAVRVRFEWDNVPGATQYVLTGKWTTAQSWTVSTAEYRVTPKDAKRWGDETVLYDVLLPAGNHSWQVVAVFRSITSGDFGHPTLKSFEIK